MLGFDYGLKRIGVAIGQELTGTARALVTVRSKDGKPEWETITRLIGQWRPDALVVGLPLDIDGGEQELSQRARRFRNQLAGRYNLPVFFQDERFSSREAEQLLAEEGGLHDKGEVDRLAAQIILQAWLDQQAGGGNE